MSPRRHLRCRGFTLVEALVALTIMTLMFASLFEVFSNGMRAVRRSDQLAGATLIAQSKLAELSLAESIERGERSGRVEGADGTRYDWRTRMEPWGRDAHGSDAESMYRLHAIEVLVAWREGPVEREFRLDSLTAVPRR